MNDPVSDANVRALTGTGYNGLPHAADDATIAQWVDMLDGGGDLPMRVTLAVSRREALIMSHALEGVEHERRNVRTDPADPANVPYVALNRIGERILLAMQQEDGNMVDTVIMSDAYVAGMLAEVER